jgi:hypothetical protein
MINTGRPKHCFLTLSPAISASLPFQAAPFFPAFQVSSFQAPTQVPESYSASCSRPNFILMDDKFEVVCLFRFASDGPTFISLALPQIAFCFYPIIVTLRAKVSDGFIFSARFIAVQQFSGQWPVGSLMRSGPLIALRFVLKYHR